MYYLGKCILLVDHWAQDGNSLHVYYRYGQSVISNAWPYHHHYHQEQKQHTNKDGWWCFWSTLQQLHNHWCLTTYIASFLVLHIICYVDHILIVNTFWDMPHIITMVNSWFVLPHVLSYLLVTISYKSFNLHRTVSQKFESLYQSLVLHVCAGFHFIALLQLLII